MDACEVTFDKSASLLLANPSIRSQRLTFKIRERAASVLPRCETLRTSLGLAGSTAIRASALKAADGSFSAGSAFHPAGRAQRRSIFPAVGAIGRDVSLAVSFGA